MNQQQQPDAFRGLLKDRAVVNIPEFIKEKPPDPFGDIDGGEVRAEEWTFSDFLERLKNKEYDEKLWWKRIKCEIIGFESEGHKDEIIGFESEGSKMFLGIAKIVISFHEKKMFSGNLVGRIRILPDLNVTHKSSAKTDEQAFENGGQRSDIDHFRWMVAEVVKTAFPCNYDRILSSKFLLFFSEIFTDPEGLKYYFVSQLYHPIFFNSSDRCNLTRMMRELYNLNPYEFKNRFELESYGFKCWWKRIYMWKDIRYGVDFLRVLKRNLNNLYGKCNGFALPLYIRNVHDHFSEGGGGYHEHIDLEIDNLFPGVSAAIIDSAIRNLHGCNSLFGHITLPHLQRTEPYGWCFPPYRYGN